ncbi:MFS transporter [Comamonas endophytica]|uniref:MFS transporter n=1 Tax=Comamonas endophytica TaxID=2949090 RepID=UPI00361961C8
MPSPDPQPSPTLVANLAVAAFMATLALAQPAGPALAQRIDLRRGLVLSALAGSLALAATGAAQSAQALVLLRAFAGMAYGLALILAQTAMLRTTPPAQRARGMTQIVGAIVAAGIVGPPFGGMVAAQAGAPAGCAACALCLLLAAFFSQRLAPVPHTAGADQATGGWRGYAAVLRNPRALAVILGAGLPARLVAVMLLAVVVPLQMNALEQPAAVTGRALLLYFLVFAISAPWIAQWSDASGRRTPFLIAGGLVGALACWALPGLGGVPGMAIGCALLGLGQALQSSPQLALVTELFEPQPGRPQHASPEQALAAFRLLERLGSIAAPFATAWAVAALGYAGALWAIGLLLALATLAMLAALRPAADAVSFNPCLDRHEDPHPASLPAAAGIAPGACPGLRGLGHRPVPCAGGGPALHHRHGAAARAAKHRSRLSQLPGARGRCGALRRGALQRQPVRCARAAPAGRGAQARSGLCLGHAHGAGAGRPP